jgi:hypothetical protein
MCIKHPHRNTFLTRHHDLARVRRGKSVPSNCIKLWRDKHSSFHYIFGNQTFKEIIFTLDIYYTAYSHTKEWKLIFRNLTLLEVVRLIERTSKIKHSLKKRWH